MLSDNWGFEILASWPFSHDVSLGTVSPGNADVKIAETKHLPPTFSMQYHFMPSGKVQPYAGLGVNYTTFSRYERGRERFGFVCRSGT